MISWLWGRRSIGKSRRCRSGVSTHREPPGPVPLRLLESRRDVGQWIDGERFFVGQNRTGVVAFPVFEQGVPHREGHAEVPLAADAPVQLEILRPVAEAKAHEVGVPLHALAGVDEIALAVEEAHEPLTGRDELEGTVALFVELHRVLDGLGLAGQGGLPVTRRRPRRIPQQPHDLLLGLPDGATGEALVVAVRGHGVEARVRLASELHRGQAPVATHHLPQGQALLAPPLHVGGVAERAHHQDPRPLLPIHEGARKDGDRNPEEGRDRPAAEELFVALVVGVRGDRDAGGQELGAGGRDDEGSPALDPEAQVVEGAPLRAVLDLGLGDRSPEVHVPQGRGLDLIDVAAAVEVEEAPLGQPPAAGADRGVLEAPVHGQAQLLPEILEGLLVLGGEGQAQLDEVRPGDPTGRLLPRRLVRHGKGEARLVGNARLTPDVVVVLDPALGGKAVVVPPHRVEAVLPGHSVEAGKHVGLRVAEHVADVERARHRRGWSVDHVARGVGVLVESMDALLRPYAAPPLLGLLRVEVRAQGARVDGDAQSDAPPRAASTRERSTIGSSGPG
jgi:hypothetical protein